MKILISFLIACAAVSSAVADMEITRTEKAKLAQYESVCATESGVDTKILEKIRKGELTDDPKLKDFLFCMSKKVGFQNDAGEIQESVVLEKLGKALKDPAKAKNLMDKCGKQSGSPSEVTYQVISCLHDNSPDHIVLV